MWLAMTLGCFVLAVAGHAVLCRTGWRIDFVTAFLISGMLAGITLLMGLAEKHCGFVESVAALLLYAFLSELYIFLFTMVSSSVSAALLMKLQERELAVSEIEANYRSQSMVQGRLAKLIRTGLLRREGGDLVVTGKTRKLLSAFRALRIYFRHREVR